MNRLNHIAIIMDGNGRWAEDKNLKRVDGHKKGAEVVREITIHSSNINLKYLTLYAFSTENWKRPRLEVEFLMKLLDRYLKNELEIYQKYNVKFETIGNLSKFSKNLQNRIKITKDKTKNNNGLTQILALNYGARDEIVRCINNMILEQREITEENISNNLDTLNFTDIDLLIRTGGEKRISNFLLWQIAYAELFFIDKFWPDFNNADLDKIIDEFNSRDRRYGGI